jgi:hypothetical protein
MQLPNDFKLIVPLIWWKVTSINIKTRFSCSLKKVLKKRPLCHLERVLKKTSAPLLPSTVNMHL